MRFGLWLAAAALGLVAAVAMFREVLRRRPDYPEIEQDLRSIGR